MIPTHFRRNFSFSLFEESNKDVASAPVKRGRGRPPKLKAILTDEADKMKEDSTEEALDQVEVNSFQSNSTEVAEAQRKHSSVDESTEPWEQNLEGNSEEVLQDCSSDESNEFSNALEEEFEDEDLFIEEEALLNTNSRDFSQNQVSLSFSWSLMNQLRQMSKMEGIPVEDLLIELVAEGVAKRVFEDLSRPTPSHLMTRTGYVHSDGTQSAPQPQLSHHNMNNGMRQQNNSQQNRNRFGFQQRNNQNMQNGRGNNGQQNRNGVSLNQNNRPQMNQNGGFRNQYNSSQQQRFNNNTRQNNYQQNNQQRYYDENGTNQSNNHSNYRNQRDSNKR